MLNSLQLATSLAFIVKWEELTNVLLSALIFVALGLVVFGMAFGFILIVTPFSVKKEIEEDQNVALGIVIGSVFIAISIIIAAAISG